MKGRKPTPAEAAWMSSIAEIGCVACLVMGFEGTPAEIHHMHGKTKPDAHFWSIPLCVRHHRGGLDTDEIVSRHPFKARFEERYGSEADLRDRCVTMMGSDPLNA